MTRAAGNLPAEPNSFIGREGDLAELSLLLRGVRVLTLCGPGGIGKTRLALRLASGLQPRFPAGAWLAELADVTEPSLVARRVAATLGVMEEPGQPLTETLARALRSRDLLLILDTCEQVVGACAALVQHLLADCPGLRVIATSREPLRVAGETVWRVPPLELPSPAGPAAGLHRSEALRLFADRAAAAGAALTLTRQNAQAVARLCRMLDGMPLAIELAAARARALSVEQIIERLSDRFALLASGSRTAHPRQRTLRATVDWSYELLSGPEQVLLRRLSVFSGWNLEMAEQVCTDEAIPEGRVLDLLAALIDKSLVTLDAEVDGDARYRLLDTVRQYAAGRLTSSGELEALRLRHRDHMLRLGESIVAQAFVRGDPPWPQRVRLYRRAIIERANFATALTVSLDRGDTEQGLRICIGLRNPWIAHGDVTEGARWFDRFLAPDPAAAAAPAAVRGRALVLRGELAFEQQDYPAAQQRATAGLALCQSAGDPHAAVGLRVLALVRMRSGDYGRALATIGQALGVARAGGDEWEEGLALAIQAAIEARQGMPRDAQRSYEAALELLRDNNGWGIAQTLYGLGALARARGDPQAAIRHFSGALGLYREIDARPEIARCLAGIGRVALDQGDVALATASLTESMQLSLATGVRLPVARCLEAFAELEFRLGKPDRAARLAGAAAGLRAAVSATAGPASSERAGTARALAPVRQRLGAAAFEALFADGQAMTADEAAGYATTGAAPPPAGPGTAGGAAGRGTAPGAARAATGLTPRELEISVLIERGLTNRAIAEELFIAPATVARHVANILAKLGFSSRAQIAAWAVTRGPGGSA